VNRHVQLTKCNFYRRSQPSRNSVTDDEHENDGDDEIGETETSVNDDLDVYHSTSEGLSEDELVTKFGKLSVEKTNTDVMAMRRSMKLKRQTMN
jgi:hypothetical protein